MRPALALEMQPGRYNLRIVEYHQRVFGKKRRKISENRFSDNSVLIMKEFRRVALGKRIFRNPLGRQRIIVIFDSYIGYHGISLNSCEVTQISEESEISQRIFVFMHFYARVLLTNVNNYSRLHQIGFSHHAHEIRICYCEFDYYLTN